MLQIELFHTCGSNDVCVLFPPEPTLTVSNLYDALEEVKELDKISHYLDIPKSKKQDINSRYSSDSQRKQAIIEEFINNHPAPSWRLVAEFLYKIDTGFNKFGKYLEALQTIKRKYLKGRKCHPNMYMMHTYNSALKIAVAFAEVIHTCMKAITIVLRKRDHGRYTLLCAQTGGGRIFVTSLHFTTKKCPCLHYHNHCTPTHRTHITKQWTKVRIIVCSSLL